MPSPIYNQPLINGNEYDYASVKMVVAGIPIFGVENIDYDESQAKENNYGAGARPVSRGRGAIEVSASIDLHMNEVEKLRQNLPERSLLKAAPFPIVVAYFNGSVFVKHILKNTEFTNDGNSGSQGDTAFVKSFDLQPSHIVFG